MQPWLLWVLAGLLVAGAELFVPGVFLLWTGLAAVATGLILMVWPGLGFGAAVGLFIALLAASIAAALALRRARDRPAEVNTPESAVVGRIGVVADLSGPSPRIRLGDSLWAAEADTPLHPGDRVEVVGVAGTRLRVRFREAAPEPLGPPAPQPPGPPAV